jgi:hypothetical protein
MEKKLDMNVIVSFIQEAMARKNTVYTVYSGVEIIDTDYIICIFMDKDTLTVSRKKPAGFLSHYCIGTMSLPITERDKLIFNSIRLDVKDYEEKLCTNAIFEFLSRNTLSKNKQKTIDDLDNEEE